MARPVMTETITPMYTRIIGGLYPVLQGLTVRDWQGLDHVPATGGFVVAANHLSWWDPFALAHFLVEAGRAPHFLAKSGLWKNPAIRTVMDGTGQIPVYRNTTAAKDAFSAARVAIADGACVMIMPEGTITKDPDLWPMAGKSGAARLALQTGCPLVPVGMWGTQDVLYPYRGKVPKLLPRKTMRVHAGAPVDLDDMRDKPITAPLLAEATTRLMARITDLVAQARQETPPASVYSAEAGR